METEVNKIIPFLDVLIDNSQNILKTSTYHKSTYSGYPPFILDKIIKAYIDKIRYNNNKVSSEVNKLRYFKLPYIGKYSEQAQKKITRLCKQYCNENNVKIVFTSFKISNYFSVKDATPYFLKSFLVYKFICARCKSCYIGETCRHFKTRIDEHIKKDKKSHFFQHLQSKEECFSSFDLNCFSILDSATTKYQTKLKEGMYIDWEKPNLNKQKNHFPTTLSI